MKEKGKARQLPTQIIHNNKIYREVGFSYANCKAYRNGNHIILVEPDGTVFHSYIREAGNAREM